MKISDNQKNFLMVAASCGKEMEPIGKLAGKVDTMPYELGGEPPTTCAICEGTGECEDVCYCAAREPFECSCGGWDDAGLDDWYGCDA